MELPSVRQLECLVAISETLNFRRAAEQCYVSQPALSAQIKHLEAQLGITLFERDKKHVLPTAAGRTLTEKAKSILAGLRDFTESSRVFSEPLMGVLRMGVIPTVAPYFLPQALSAVHREFPNLQLILREDETSRLVASLERGELDVLLLALEANLGSAETRPICRDPFWLATPIGHDFAHRDSVGIADLSDAEVLLLEDGHCLRDQALEICERAETGENDDFRASSLTTLVQMVAGGLGVTLLPEMAIALECGPSRNLKAIPFESPAPERTIGLAFRASSVRAGEFETLAQFLSQEFTC